MKIKKIKHAVKSAVSVLKTKRVVPVLKTIDKERTLEGKIALITGGSGGIGFSIAESLKNSGCTIILVGTNKEKLEENCTRLGENAYYKIVDLKNIANLKEIVKDIFAEYKKIDILVNSAGIHSNRSLNSFFDITEEDYDSIMAINLKATYFMSKYVAENMIKNKIHGHILNISSSVSNEPAWSPYRLSKLGLNGLTKGMAEVLIKYGIVVNGIAPGSTATKMLDYKDGDTIYTGDNKLGRMVMPEEIAEFARMLVSDAGNMVVGETLFISGGRGVFDIR